MGHCPLSKMARGPKKHLKRLAAPKSWMLDKLGGVFAPRPSTGPHKLRESLPMVVFLRNRLKYALNNSEVTKIVMQRLIKVDGKVRTDPNYPAGFMDVITIDKTGEYFRLVYDVKGRVAIHRITAEEAQYKLCKVKRVQVGPKGIPFLTTHDGRTIRYPDPLVKVNDTIQLDIMTSKIKDFIKFESGNLCMITGDAIWVESVPSSTVNVTPAPSILSTLRMLLVIFSPLDRTTSSSSVRAAKLTSLCHATRASN